MLNPVPVQKLGFYVAAGTAAVTLVTFVIAILTPPLSGPFCTEGCYQYPYHDIVPRFPRDYYWLFPAMLLMLLYTALMACIYQHAATDKKIYGLLGTAFAIISALILIINYFIQVTVIQPTLLNGETDGIALLTQYNPHGIFIALEEAGYLIMSLSFLSITPIFAGKNRLENSIRWTLFLSFLIALLSLIAVLSRYGFNREYIFEVIIISIDFITLIVAGIMLAQWFRKTGTPQNAVKLSALQY